MQASPKSFFFSVVNTFEDGSKQQEIHTVITCCENVAVTALVDDLKERHASKPNWHATIMLVTELQYNAIRTRLQEKLQSQYQQALLN